MAPDAPKSAFSAPFTKTFNHRKSSFVVPQRPPFNSRLTTDRLRESAIAKDAPFMMDSKLRKGRRSVFVEIGLVDSNGKAVPQLHSTIPEEKREELLSRESLDPRSEPPSSQYYHTNAPHEQEDMKQPDTAKAHRTTTNPSLYTRLSARMTRPRVQRASNAPASSSSATSLVLLVMLVAIVTPAFSSHLGWTREDSPAKTCRRWAQQVALLNGTVYMYGGRSTTQQGQTENTWNNDFLTLDLTKKWGSESPALKGLATPDGPPAVALGYLWHDFEKLYLYGGQFSDTPFVSPGPESLWQYAVKDESWTEYKNPETSSGNYSEPEPQPVHRAAEGAGLSVPELGLSWYFGGHLDAFTVPGWSSQVKRVYLKSLLEFTHPGYINSGVDNLRSTGAGESGAFRNITQGGGVQADDFPERADGVLVYVPGWGKSGCLIGLAGGTADDFTPDLGTLDVYDIASSEWFHQKTTGDTPNVRVNPCAVIASAADASSFQIYLFGGQNLQPYGKQTQYNDMYILTIPSFTWIKVDSSDSAPSPRAGHTCTLQDGQLILIGGYSGGDAPCETSSGIYVFDASNLRWTDTFTPADHPADFHPENSVLAGSYGYKVPSLVQSVIGGDSHGGASASTPAAGSASLGPFATGKPPVFTVTRGVATQTVTSRPSSNSSSDDGNDDDDDDSSDGPSSPPSLIAAGVIAGLAGMLSLYLGFCAILHRRQIKAYKRHLAISNNYYNSPSSRGLETAEFSSSAVIGKKRSKYHKTIGSADDEMNTALFNGKTSHLSYSGSTSNGRGGGEWDDETPWLREPKWMNEDEEGDASGSRTVKTSIESRSSSDEFEGGEPSFFSVVLAPRRALRVVNGVD